MKTICLHDKDRIEVFLRRNTFLNIYQLGDLDERFFPHTEWYALADGEEIKAIALIYSGLSTPTLLAMGEDGELPLLQDLLRSIAHVLPETFYSHLSIGLTDTLPGAYRITSHGEHSKMALTNPEQLDRVDTSQIVPFTAGDADELLKFYAEAHPAHYFEPPMLETNQYFGIRDCGEIVAAAGVHVYSEQYKVAALANIATHPDHRRKGCARRATAALCRNLLKTVDHVGLNVKADNDAAIGLYRQLGFEVIAAYEDCRCVARPRPDRVVI